VGLLLIVLLPIAVLFLIKPTRLFLISMVLNLRAFGKEVMEELKKVSWPARTELKNSTGLVILSTLMLALFVWVIDLALRAVMALIVR